MSREAMKQALDAPQKPVAWAGVDLDAMCEAFSRCIEAQHAKNHPFHNPVNSDAMTALRILRGLVPAMKAYAAPAAPHSGGAACREYMPDVRCALACCSDGPDRKRMKKPTQYCINKIGGEE
jgi:hypothetical protein